MEVEATPIYRSVLFSAAAAYIFYYLRWVVKKPAVYCNVKIASFLEEHVPVLSEKFWPTLWCIEARCQTVIRSLFNRKKNITYQREKLNLPDGGVVALDWASESLKSSQSDTGEEKPTVIIMPGLVGTSRESYVLQLVDECVTLRYRSVVFNYRGNGGMELKTPLTYCATETRDLDNVVRHVISKFPKSPVMAVGISLGGVILTNYVAKSGSKCRLKAAMTVSIPWNVFESARSLEEPLNAFIFNRHLTECLKKNVAQHEHHFVDKIDFSHVYKSNTIRDFDERFTCRVFGYKDHKDYYEEACPDRKIHDISIPVLNLNSEDDPFAPLNSIPIHEAQSSKSVAIVLTSRGGHIGFLEGIFFPRSTGFIERVFSQFSSAIFNHGDKLVACTESD